jgi:Holliday junction DNA helicase RuvA
MISSVTGTLAEVSEDRIYLATGPFTLELLVPASSLPSFLGSVGKSITLHTILYLEGDSSGGNSEPRLLGFLDPVDKRFFEKFITVKGIGPRKALRALTASAAELAGAIEHKDAKRLSQLPGIGKRTAETIIAELSGKLEEFLHPGARYAAAALPAHTPAEDDAILTLLTLGERRPEAESLLARAKQVDPTLRTTDAFVRAMLALRSGR